MSKSKKTTTVQVTNSKDQAMLLRAANAGVIKVVVANTSDNQVKMRGRVSNGNVQMCWETFYQNCDLPRADVIALCVSRGAMPGTAATQYQRFKSMLNA